MEYLAYIQLFTLYISGIVLYFFPGTITYKAFAFIIAVVSALIIIIRLIVRKLKIRGFSLIVVLIMSVFVICYRFVTPAFYAGSAPANYYGEFLALLGQTFPGVLTASIISTMETEQEKMKKLSISVSILFTFIALICTMRPTASTSGGFADNDNNLNYQSLSYLAAYGAAMAEYYLVCYEVKKNKVSIIMKAVSIIIIVLNLFTILLTGGRGGLVAYAVFAVITFFLYVKKNQWTLSQIIKGVILFLGVIVSLYFAIQLASNATISTSGFKRIVNFLNWAGDSIRYDLRYRAIQSFREKPIFGHGIGSVYYELGFYSHNFIQDLLVETGLAGTTIVICFLIYVLYQLFKAISLEITDSFWLYLLLCGIIELSFSGYYLASICTWWVCVFVVSKAHIIKCKSISMTKTRRII